MYERRFSLSEISKEIKQAYTELTGNEANPYFIYQHVRDAKKRAREEGGRFWEEPVNKLKLHTEEQVAGILDELHRKMGSENFGQRRGSLRFVALTPSVLNEAERRLFNFKAEATVVYDSSQIK